MPVSKRRPVLLAACAHPEAKKVSRKTVGRQPKKFSKRELYAMLADAVRNTGQNSPPTATTGAASRPLRPDHPINGIRQYFAVAEPTPRCCWLVLFWRPGTGPPMASRCALDARDQDAGSAGPWSNGPARRRWNSLSAHCRVPDIVQRIVETNAIADSIQGIADCLADLGDLGPRKPNLDLGDVGIHR